MNNNHPEADMYEKLAEEMDFHVSNRFSPHGEQKVALVDIDETICFYSGKRQYDLAEPDKENIAKINKLYDEGWKIVYWTARGGSGGIDYYSLTKQQLGDWDAKYHELSVAEKPLYDLVIDDKAKRIEEL